MLAAITAVHKGEKFYSRAVSQKLAGMISSRKLDPVNLELNNITPFELRIIRLICMGKETREIANEMKF